MVRIESVLYRGVERSKTGKFKTLISEWIRKYDVDRGQGLSDIGDLLLRYSGYVGDVELIEFPMNGWIERVEESRKFSRVSLNKKQLENVGKFFMRFVVETWHGRLFEENGVLMESVIEMVVRMGESRWRLLRRICTISGMGFGIGLCSIGKMLMEQGRCGGDDLDMKEIVGKIERGLEKLFYEMVENRLYDVDKLIRGISIGRFGEWMRLWPEQFGNGRSWEQIERKLRDRGQEVRIETMRLMIKLMEVGDLWERMRGFVKQNVGLVIETCMNDRSGQRVGIDLMNELIRQDCASDEEMKRLIEYIVDDVDKKTTERIGRLVLSIVSRRTKNRQVDEKEYLRGVVEWSLIWKDMDRLMMNEIVRGIWPQIRKQIEIWELIGFCTMDTVVEKEERRRWMMFVDGVVEIDRLVDEESGWALVMGWELMIERYGRDSEQTGMILGWFCRMFEDRRIDRFVYKDKARMVFVFEEFGRIFLESRDERVCIEGSKLMKMMVDNVGLGKEGRVLMDGMFARMMQVFQSEICVERRMNTIQQMSLLGVFFDLERECSQLVSLYREFRDGWVGVREEFFQCEYRLFVWKCFENRECKELVDMKRLMMEVDLIDRGKMSNWMVETVGNMCIVVFRMGLEWEGMRQISEWIGGHVRRELIKTVVECGGDGLGLRMEKHMGMILMFMKLIELELISRERLDVLLGLYRLIPGRIWVMIEEKIELLMRETDLEIVLGSSMIVGYELLAGIGQDPRHVFVLGEYLGNMAKSSRSFEVVVLIRHIVEYIRNRMEVREHPNGLGLLGILELKWVESMGSANECLDLLKELEGLVWKGVEDRWIDKSDEKQYRRAVELIEKRIKRTASREHGLVY